VSCTGAANAAVEQNKGTNAIAFSEQRGNQSANLVLSRLDLAMMDPVERDNMLASLETQYGKPKVWVSRKGRSPFMSMFTFGGDGDKEKYGVRLRARQALPSFNSDLAQVVPAEKVPAALGDMASADLLGVERSEVLTWSIYQDDYLTGTSFRFVKTGEIKWLAPEFTWKWSLDTPDGRYINLLANGVQFKTKLSCDSAARLAYNQHFWKGQYRVHDVNKQTTTYHDHDGMRTRNIAASGSLSLRNYITFTLAWGHDWPLAWFGHFGLGVEASGSFGFWNTAEARMLSYNTKKNDEGNYIAAGWNPSISVEIQGTAWIGQTEHKENDGLWAHFYGIESHKFVGGAKADIVFVGGVGFGVQARCTEYDWSGDKYNDKMEHRLRIGNLALSGAIKGRVGFRWGDVTWQDGYELWSGRKDITIFKPQYSEYNERFLDLLL
jgi:hypothetical protein